MLRHISGALDLRRPSGPLDKSTAAPSGGRPLLYHGSLGPGLDILHFARLEDGLEQGINGHATQVLHNRIGPFPVEVLQTDAAMSRCSTRQTSIGKPSERRGLPLVRPSTPINAHQRPSTPINAHRRTRQGGPHTHACAHAHALTAPPPVLDCCQQHRHQPKLHLHCAMGRHGPQSRGHHLQHKPQTTSRHANTHAHTPHLSEGACRTARTTHRTACAPRAQSRVLSFVCTGNFQGGRDAVASWVSMQQRRPPLHLGALSRSHGRWAHRGGGYRAGEVLRKGTRGR